MNKRLRLLASASLLAVAALGATPAVAAGTTAGTTITNEVTLSYQVGGVAQADVEASAEFVVDRVILLTVAELGSATTTVAPGQAAAVTTFQVTNTSNAGLDLALSVAQQVGGAGAHANTDNFDVTAPALFVDSNGNDSYDAGVDLAATYLDEVAEDDTITVFVVADVPAGRATGDVAAVTLTATAREGGSAGSQGAAITETAGANTAGVDTVFGDGAGATDAARDGAHSAKDDYTVAAADLTVQKLSTIVSDPFNGATDPKMIPGAVVEYCVTVSNAAGSATATNISISDTLPANVSYDAGFGILVDATVAGASCNGGSAGGAFAAGTITAPLSDIAAGGAAGVRFRVTVD